MDIVIIILLNDRGWDHVLYFAFAFSLSLLFYFLLLSGHMDLS